MSHSLCCSPCPQTSSLRELVLCVSFNTQLDGDSNGEEDDSQEENEGSAGNVTPSSGTKKLISKLGNKHVLSVLCSMLPSLRGLRSLTVCEEVDEQVRCWCVCLSVLLGVWMQVWA